MLIHEWACFCFLGSDASISYKRTLVSTKNRSPPGMSFLAAHAAGGVDTLDGGHSLPLSISAPIVITGTHLALQHTADQFRDRGIFFSCLAARPKRNVLSNSDGDVL